MISWATSYSVRVSAILRLIATSSVSRRSAMPLNAPASCPISSRELFSTRIARSPVAMRLAAWASWRIGLVNWRTRITVSSNAIPRLTRVPMTKVLRMADEVR